MPKQLVALALLSGVVCVALSASAFAHHSVVVNFDSRKTVEVTGVVKELDMRNPHSQITVVETKPDGSSVEWFFEWSDKNSLVRRGVPYERIRVGDKVKILGIAARRLANVGYFQTAVLPDGSILKDCGFGAYREAVANSTKLTCE
jgi:hypothetical protein